MKWSEAQVIRALSYQVLDRQCLLMVDNCGWTGHECDILAVTKDRRIIDIEVKISRQDFRADAKKDKWWHRRFVGWRDNKMNTEASPREWPQKVWKHYYALPADIWREDLLAQMPSQASGVILLDAGKPPHPEILANVVKRAKPNPRAHVVTESECLGIARLANLRMWEAYHKARPVEVMSRPRVRVADTQDLL